MNVSEYIMQEVEKYTDHVFCLVGGGSMFLNEALGKSKVTPVFMLHEQGAGFAAQAYGHLTNKLGVCMVTSGPGATNAITPCLAAWMDSTPMLFISGQVQTKHSMAGTGLRYRGPQECDIVEMVRPITKYAQEPSDAFNARLGLHAAIHNAINGRKGPTWLSVSLDIQNAEVE